MAQTITPRIVNINTTIVRAPTPSQLQQSGALVSIGGTTLATGAYQFCGQLSDVQALLLASGSGNFAELNEMATTFFAQGNVVGCYVLELGYTAAVDDQIALLAAWITANPQVFYAFLVPADWDQSKDEVGSVTISAQGSGYLAVPTVTIAAPGGGGTTATGTAVLQNNGVLEVEIGNPGSKYTTAPAVTFSAPSEQAAATCTLSGEAVNVITIGTPGWGYPTAPTISFTAAPEGGTTATGHGVVNAAGVLTSIVIDNAGAGYLVAPTITISAPPAGVTATGTANLASVLGILAGDYSSPTGLLYFFVTTNATNAGNYSTIKSVIAMVPAPTAPSTEFTAAMAFYQWLVNDPGPANQLAPMAFRYAYGVTPWANINNPNIQTILTAYGNTILTGAEGGISTACLFRGTTMDGEQASWWYGIDWIQIQVHQALAAAIINGSNSNPPLLYNQDGINTLKKVAQNIADSAVKFGCALSAVVTATPFATYTKENPNDYNAGIYNGFSCTAVGQNGFLQITFQLAATQFAV